MTTTGLHSNQSQHGMLKSMQTKPDPISDEAWMLVNDFSLGLWFVIGSAGILTNVINIQTFIKMGLEDSVTISFFALALSDLIVSSLALAQPMCFLITLLMKASALGFILPYSMANLFIRAVGSAFTQITVLITTFLAVQRCLCVLLPFHIRGLFTKVKTYIFITIVTFFSVTCFGLFTSRFYVAETVIAALNTTMVSVQRKPESEPYVFLADVLLGLFVNTCCVSTVIICLVIMFITLQKSVKFRKEATVNAPRNNTKGVSGTGTTTTKKDKPSAKETQALRQVFVISSIFVSTNSPYAIFGIVGVLIQDFALYHAYHNTYLLGLTYVLTSEYVNSAVNFFIYYKFNSKFRNVCFLTTKKETLPIKESH